MSQYQEGVPVPRPARQKFTDTLGVTDTNLLKVRSPSFVESALTARNLESLIADVAGGIGAPSFSTTISTMAPFPAVLPDALALTTTNALLGVNATVDPAGQVNTDVRAIDAVRLIEDMETDRATGAVV